MEARYYAAAGSTGMIDVVIDVLPEKHDEKPGRGAVRRACEVHPLEGLPEPHEWIVGLLGYGHVAVVPLRVATPMPQLTTQVLPTQLLTVQPVAGHVT